MAVYTEIQEDELDLFLARYDVGQALSVKGIAEGVENSNFLLHTERGFFILTLYEKRVREEDLPFFLALMNHLAGQGLNCPLAVAARDGATLGRLSQRPAALITFLDGVSVKRPTPAHCAEVGEALARLHAAGRDFPLNRPNVLSLAGWPPLAEAAGARTDEVRGGLKSRIEEELAHLHARWPADLPSGVIHADLFTDNVFFIAGRLSGIIDFYFACNDLLAYDLAICLNAWCFEADGSFNLTKGRNMIAGYERVRRLQPEEVEALPTLCRGAALRFLLTRLVDWLNVPPGALVKPKDPLEYDRKLGFHRMASSAADYGWGR